MKQKLLQSLPYIIVALIIYFVLLLIFHKEYVYLYTEWFIDEWVVITIATPIYIAFVFASYFAIRYITADENRVKKLALACLAIGIVVGFFAVMKKYTDYQEAEHQRQLDIANENSKWVDESYQRIQRDCLDADLKASGKK